MSQENVELVRRANAAFNSGDIASIRDAFHPDVVLEDKMHGPDAPPTVRGVDAVVRVVTEWRDTFASFTADVEEYIEAGDWVVCLTHWHGAGTGGGTPVDQHTADIYEVQAGQIVQAVLSYRSREEALEAVGLSE